MGKSKTMGIFEQNLILRVKSNFVPRCRCSVFILELPVTEGQRHFPITLIEETNLFGSACQV